MRHISVIPLVFLLALSGSSQTRRRVVPPPEWTRILLPYEGGSFGSATGLHAELVMRNESDHALQYHLYSSADCMIEGCLPPLQITKTIAPGGMIVDLYTTLPQGRVLSVSDVDALNLSLRAQEFYVGGSIGPEGAFKGPEVPIARGHDFRKSIHIVSVPVHLNTYLRVYSLDSAPTVHVRLFNVEFEREVMLEEFDLALAQPVYDGPFVMLPAWAERDLSAELAALDQRIPQGRIAFRIESPAPIWAMVMQHDPQRHVATFVTQQ